jgi:hypothetical protein
MSQTKQFTRVRQPLTGNESKVDIELEEVGNEVILMGRRIMSTENK